MTTTCRNGHSIAAPRDWVTTSAGNGRRKRHCRACYELKQARKRARWTTTRKVVRAANYEARKLGLQATLTEAEWLHIIDAYEGRCAYCFDPYEHLEHRIALSDGGPTTADNVVPSCKRCNMKKASRNLVPSLTSAYWPPDQHLLKRGGIAAHTS